MASSGPNYPSSGVNSARGGSAGSWTSPGNVTADDATESSFVISLVADETISLMIGGSVVGSNKAITTTTWGASSVVTYGGSSDLWGLTPTVSEINASDFGVAIAVKTNGGSNYSDYIHAAGFGFSIPSGSTIDGVVVELDRRRSANIGLVDYVRVTVYYTEGGGGGGGGGTSGNLLLLGVG